MRFFRKNDGGSWIICNISVEDAVAIQSKVAKVGLGKYAAIKKLAEENKIEISEQAIAVILDKVTPSYESLANDFIEEKLKEKKA